MTRAGAVLACVTLGCVISGCGTYGITYQFPSRMAPKEQTREVVTHHAHGVGPFIVGGGGFFFLFQSMSPALIDYTGEVEIEKICPSDGEEISEVRHYHHFGQNSLAALISWLAIGNWYHQSNVVYECVSPAAPGGKAG